MPTAHTVRRKPDRHCEHSRAGRAFLNFTSADTLSQKSTNDKIVMEQVVVQGSQTGVIVTYELPDGSPVDPAAENALRSLWP
jgi:hypothetical protein